VRILFEKIPEETQKIKNYFAVENIQVTAEGLTVITIGAMGVWYYHH